MFCCVVCIYDLPCVLLYHVSHLRTDAERRCILRINTDKRKTPGPFYRSQRDWVGEVHSVVQRVLDDRLLIEKELGDLCVVFDSYGQVRSFHESSTFGWWNLNCDKLSDF